MKMLLLIDLQNDFLPGGALPVPEGDAVIAIANQLEAHFDLIVATQDWHPANHGSFAVNHPGKKSFDQILLNGLRQTLWPVHCVQNSSGAALAAGLNKDRISKVFHKGVDPAIDSYSAFFDNGHLRATGLAEWLRSQGATDLFLCGLATDYCVKFSALDAVQLGFKVHLVEDGCRGINLAPKDVAEAIAEMQAAGVRLVGSKQLDLKR